MHLGLDLFWRGSHKKTKSAAATEGHNGIPGGSSLHPSEGVAGIGSVFLVVPRADHGIRGRIVPLVAAGSQCTPMVALSVSLLFR